LQATPYVIGSIFSIHFQKLPSKSSGTWKELYRVTVQQPAWQPPKSTAALLPHQDDSASIHQWVDIDLELLNHSSKLIAFRFPNHSSVPSVDDGKNNNMVSIGNSSSHSSYYHLFVQLLIDSKGSSPSIIARLFHNYDENHDNIGDKPSPSIGVLNSQGEIQFLPTHPAVWIVDNFIGTSSQTLSSSSSSSSPSSTVTPLLSDNRGMSLLVSPPFEAARRWDEPIIEPFWILFPSSSIQHQPMYSSDNGGNTQIVGAIRVWSGSVVGQRHHHLDDDAPFLMTARGMMTDIHVHQNRTIELYHQWQPHWYNCTSSFLLPYLSSIGSLVGIVMSYTLCHPLMDELSSIQSTTSIYKGGYRLINPSQIYHGHTIVLFFTRNTPISSIHLRSYAHYWLIVTLLNNTTCYHVALHPTASLRYVDDTTEESKETKTCIPALPIKSEPFTYDWLLFPRNGDFTQPSSSPSSSSLEQSSNIYIRLSPSFKGYQFVMAYEQQWNLPFDIDYGMSPDHVISCVLALPSGYTDSLRARYPTRLITCMVSVAVSFQPYDAQYEIMIGNLLWTVRFNTPTPTMCRMFTAAADDDINHDCVIVLTPVTKGHLPGTSYSRIRMEYGLGSQFPSANIAEVELF
jgi:hypothetical protein